MPTAAQMIVCCLIEVRHVVYFGGICWNIHEWMWWMEPHDFWCDAQTCIYATPYIYIYVYIHAISRKWVHLVDAVAVIWSAWELSVCFSVYLLFKRRCEEYTSVSLLTCDQSGKGGSHDVASECCNQIVMMYVVSPKSCQVWPLHFWEISFLKW